MRHHGSPLVAFSGPKKPKGKAKGKRKKARPASGNKKDPSVLWRTDPDKRPADVWGVISPGPEDMIIAIAKGAKTSFATRPLDDRATIRGGISALHAAGLSDINPNRLKSLTSQGKKEDQKLIQAAGGGKTLKDAANRVRAQVSEAGPGLERAAWGSRGIYILSNLKGFQVGRGVAAGVAAVLGPVGAIVGALMAGHGAISNAVAEGAGKKFAAQIKSGLDAYRKSRKASDPEMTVSAAPLPAALTPPMDIPWVWIGGGAAALAVVIAVRRRSGGA